MKISFFNAPIYQCIDSSTIQYSGNNNKNILIICQNFENAEINDFIGKIMKAVNTDLIEDTRVLNLKENESLSWAEISNDCKAIKVIFFGIDPDKLGLHLNIVKYQLINWNNIRILYSDKLEEIISDKNKKGFLWRELQKMFDQV
jgi:hypothetical protein